MRFPSRVTLTAGERAAAIVDTLLRVASLPAAKIIGVNASRGFGAAELDNGAASD